MYALPKPFNLMIDCHFIFENDFTGLGQLSIPEAF
jgi:hypothetical protein